MLGSRFSTSQSSISVHIASISGINYQYFTFWDMDDTSVITNAADNTIKNPHLLLPILLFQSHASNQHLGIMTNRAPSDIDTGHSVKQYLKDLKTFGINIPSSHVIFGGGENAVPLHQSYDSLTEAIATLTHEIESMNLTEPGQVFLKLLNMENEKNNALTAFLNAKYKGKNYFITTFLNQYYDTNSNIYKFNSGICSREHLKVCIVDDLESISEAPELLGTQFVGIKAARGGNPPKKSVEIEEDDYDTDQYLLNVAKEIGLFKYFNELISQINSGESKALDHNSPLLMLSALFYGWHAHPELIDEKVFNRFYKLLTYEESIQITRMLDCICQQSMPTTRKHYRPMDSLAYTLQIWTDLKFLDQALVQYLELTQKLHAEEAQLVFIKQTASESELSKIDSKSSNKSGSKLSKFIRQHSMRSKRENESSYNSSSSSPPYVLAVQNPLEILNNQINILLSRVENLSKSDNLTISDKADIVMVELKSNARRKNKVEKKISKPSSESSRTMSDIIVPASGSTPSNYTPGFNYALVQSSSSAPIELVSLLSNSVEPNKSSFISSHHNDDLVCNAEYVESSRKISRK